MRHDGAMHRHPGRDIRHDTFEILENGGVVGKGRTQPAIGFGDARQQRAHVAERPPGGAIDHLLIAPFLGMRGEIPGEKFAELVAKDVQFLGHPG